MVVYDYKPETTEWLQLEEIKVDYTMNKEDGLRYKIICKDLPCTSSFPLADAREA